MNRLYIVLIIIVCWSVQAAASPAPIYVSKLGDNSDGSSWAHAFHTIQAALAAVPDSNGGHHILIRPDTYFEANLFPAHRGARNAYNRLLGDFDGTFGSGSKGYVIIDCGDPQQRGFKSYDWWGPVRSYSKGWSQEHQEETFSAIGWDRWHLRHLYVSGGDGGLFFDLTDQVKPFSVVVEDCISIGRAFGVGVASCLSRPEEPITFRRCHCWALDWWGDTAGAYVRVENKTMPEEVDALFEECVMVGPQCAFKSSNYGFHTYSHCRLSRCTLICLNFSQPQGTPTDGIIQSVQEGKLLWVDLDDCTLMGYKVFGVKVKKETVTEIRYTCQGDVKAYIQFQQELPAGMLRLGHWPVDIFQNLLPPTPLLAEQETKNELVQRDVCEVSPFIWHGRLCHMICVRPSSGGQGADHYIVLQDAETKQELGRCGQGYSLASMFVHKDTAYIFASRWEKNGWQDVTLFTSADLQHWRQSVVIKGEKEGLFNSSVCKGKDGFVMAYESDDKTYAPFTIKFAVSKDLKTWHKVPDTVFGAGRYAACPAIRFVDGYYYLLYLEHRTPRWYFETYIARSLDLVQWELSAANPVLQPHGLQDGINASDPDLIEYDKKTYLYYAVGDQRTWMNVKRAVYPQPLPQFLASWFTAPAIPECLPTAK